MRSALLLGMLALALVPVRVEAQEPLAVLNAARHAAGVAPVTLDASLSHDVQLHLAYLRTNAMRPDTVGLAAHQEDPSRPGYTAAGAHAGTSSDLATEPLASAIGHWIGSLYHRTPMLRPSLHRVGMAEIVIDGVTVSALMFDGDDDDGAGYPIAFPGDGQTDVPISFEGEIPDPVPGGADASGYPITLAFGYFAEVTQVSATLTDARGQAIALYLSSPEHPATSFPQGGAVRSIPREALSPATTYRVTVHARSAEHEVTRSWSFTTVTPIAVDASDRAALARAAGRLVTLSGDVISTGTIPDFHYLTLHASDPVASVLVSDARWPDFAAAGIDLHALESRRVSLVGVVRAVGSDFVVRLDRARDLHVIASAAPTIAADDAGIDAFDGRIARVTGRVSQVGHIEGYAFLQIGSSSGRMVSILVPDASVSALRIDLASTTGRAIAATGPVSITDGRYVNVQIDRRDQLELLP